MVRVGIFFFFDRDHQVAGTLEIRYFPHPHFIHKETEVPRREDQHSVILGQLEAELGVFPILQ